MSKKITFLLACAFVVLMFGCGSSFDPVGNENGTNSTHSTTNTADTTENAESDNSDDHEDSDDYSWDSSKVVEIVLEEDSITVDSNYATVNGSTVTITSAATYSISGSLTDGQIIVDTQDDDIVRLILNGVDITCTSSAPVYIANADKAMIVMAEGTENHITDGASYQFDYGEDEPNAAIFSKSDLTICGEGSLDVDGNYNDGIASKDGLIIKSGMIVVDAADDGIRGKDYLIVKDGDITITADGDGLKSDNGEDTAKGYVLIEAGDIDITSDGDGIEAETDALIANGTVSITSGGGSNKTVFGDDSAKGIKGCTNVIVDGGTITINSADDAIHSNNNVTINDGTFTIKTNDDAVHAEETIAVNGGTIGITKCYEGMESPSITVNSGDITIVSSDDGFNATAGNGGESNDGSYLYINGGTITVTTSNGDGFDSNGNIVMTDGTVILNGPASQVEVPIDFNGTFQISGGLLVAAGANSGHMVQTTSSSSAQYCVKATSSSALSTSTLFHVQDASGNDILTFKPVRSIYFVIFSSPDLENGSTYYIYTGGSSTGTNTNGLYSGGTYSGGTLKRSFKISSKITSVSF